MASPTTTTPTIATPTEGLPKAVRFASQDDTIDRAEVPTINAQPPDSTLLSEEAAVRAADYFSRLEILLRGLENRARQQHNSPSISEGDVDEPIATTTPPPLLKTLQLFTEVREFDWEHFVNRFAPDDPKYIIEVLVAGHDLEKDVEKELKRRVPGSSHRPDSGSQTIRRVYNNDKWIQRVRIQSRTLLEIFSKVTGYAWRDQPHTFIRPFQYFVYFHEKIKNELEKMETEMDASQKFEEIHVGPPAALHDSIKGAQYPTELLDSRRDDVAKETASEDVVQSDGTAETSKQDHTSTALEELRCYIKFVEEQILPDTQRFLPNNTSVRQKIRFSDICYLFTPGQLIYISDKLLARVIEPEVQEMNIVPEIPPGTNHPSCMSQNVWRVRSVETPNAQDLDQQPGPVVVTAYYLDFDGLSYSAVDWYFLISPFEGDKDVHELDFYPLHFRHNYEQILEKGSESGRYFTEAVSGWHLYYDGWTFVTDPQGFPIVDMSYYQVYRRQKRPLHVQGHVIVDFQEAYNSEPSYKRNFVDGEAITAGQSFRLTSASKTSLITWADSRRSIILNSVTDQIVTQDDCFAHAHDDYLNNDPYLKAGTRPKAIPPTSREDLALLPPRVFVYALRQRKFVPVDVRKLRSITVQQNALAQLQLPKLHKSIIQAAIRSHLRRQRIERRIEAVSELELKAQDFIVGKGRGLLVMLHGEPGVGKTATAEAVAQSTQRPLFPINCSDLDVPGPTGGLEERLDEIFRLAHLWDCVLLMDEADVFLTARNNQGSRNNLVSVFLRKLEYYNGILFLTTNRIGKLDPAMSSRLHLILHYKRLGPVEIQGIFQTNIKRLMEAEKQQKEISGEPALFVLEDDVLRFAADHCAKHPMGKGAWNGRQIRNAFIVASSLARDEAERFVGSGFQPQLRYSHFEEVERLTADYDRFRAHVLGGDDARKARLNEERDDDFGYDDGDSEERGLGRNSKLKLADLLYAVQQVGSAAPSQQTAFGTTGDTAQSSSNQKIPNQSQWRGQSYGQAFATQKQQE